MARTIVEATLRLLLLPFIMLVNHQSTNAQRIMWFQFTSEFLSFWPFQIGVIARRLFYERTLASCGVNFRTRIGVVFVYPEATVGNNVRLGRDTSVGLVDLEDDVIVAHRASLISGRRHHRTERADVPMRLRYGVAERIRIGAGSWIGADTTVTSDVGLGAVVGAGSVVVKPVPEYAVVVGNPARVVRIRGQEEAVQDAIGWAETPAEAGANAS